MLSKWGTPKKVEFCSRCVISNQRPGSVPEFQNKNVINVPNETLKKSSISFTNGVCNACLYHDYKYNIVDWSSRESELLRLLDRHRKSDGSFDVVVPGSGGKDSAYVSHILKYKYGMNPLTVTWAPHSYTDIGWQNFQNWLQSGHDNILFTPDRSVHRELTSLAFKNLLHPFQPFIIGQKFVGPRIAQQFGIDLVFYGENQAEGGSNLNWDECMMPLEFYTNTNNSNFILSGCTLKDLSDHGISESDLNYYKPLNSIRPEIEVHFMSYYRKWVPQENYYYAVENCGFRENTVRSEGTYSTYSSLDDKIDGFHYYTTFIKYGIGRATYDASQEIRNHHITRDEALTLVKKYDGEFPSRHFDHFLKYIDISEDEFINLIDSARSPHIWELRDSVWCLKDTVY